MDGGGIQVSAAEVLEVLGGSVLFVPESTLASMSSRARTAFVEAAEQATSAVVFVVPDLAYLAEL